MMRCWKRKRKNDFKIFTTKYSDCDATGKKGKVKKTENDVSMAIINKINNKY